MGLLPVECPSNEAAHFWFSIINFRRDASISFKVYRRVMHCKIQVKFEFLDHL